MPIEDKLYIVGNRGVAGLDTGAIWTWDGASLVLVDDLAVGGHETQLTGGVLFSGDGCMYLSGWWYDGATTHTGIIWKWDGTSFSIEYHDTAAEARFFDIVEFGGALYAIHRSGGSGNTVVLKRTGPGVWVQVLDTTQGSWNGGLFKIAGDGGTEYLIAWSGISNTTRPKFHYTTDGTTWDSAGDLGVGGWGHLSYLFWDDDNSVYRCGVYNVANERTSATMASGSWGDGGAHGHPTAPYEGWGDHDKNAGLDVRVGLYAGSTMRKWNGAAWADEYTFAEGALSVSEYQRACWLLWKGILRFAARTGGSYVTLYKLDGAWGVEKTLNVGGVTTMVVDILLGGGGLDRRRYSTRVRSCGLGC